MVKLTTKPIHINLSVIGRLGGDSVGIPPSLKHWSPRESESRQHFRLKRAATLLRSAREERRDRGQIAGFTGEDNFRIYG